IISMVLNGLENRIKASQFDKEGNVSFGIREHIDIPGVRYDPDIGIFGMDVSVTFEKPGHRIKDRRLRPKKIPKHQRVTPEEAMELMKEKFQVTIE
ncbi:MAG: 50S ribosomal protein L5, partial [Methanosphaera sp. rholeuAM130]